MICNVLIADFGRGTSVVAYKTELPPTCFLPSAATQDGCGGPVSCRGSCLSLGCGSGRVNMHCVLLVGSSLSRVHLASLLWQSSRSCE